MASYTGINLNLQLQQEQGEHFDLQKLSIPSSPSSLISPNTNTTPTNFISTSPSLPSPSSTPTYPTSSSSFPPSTAVFNNPNYPNPLYHFRQDHLQQHQQYQFPNIQHQPQRPISYAVTPTSPNSNISGGARLMAFLSNQKPSFNANPDLPQPTIAFSTASNEFTVPSNPPPASLTSAPSAPTLSQATPMRLPSRKLPKGRHLTGHHVVYDIDVRFRGEMQPQLEVTPITKYTSDPELVLGRQIAVNKSYICYGLKQGAIRVLDINTALRSLLRGHTQRVTDMAFFAEDVHLLASASIDGRVFIWKISETPDEENKHQITGKVVLAIQILGVEDSVHPRLCWHPHKQEILIVAIGNRILRVDMIKVGKGKTFSAGEPLKCPIDKLVDGVQIIGNHDDEVTDLSMCQWMTSRLASASRDGMVKIWEDRKPLPLAVLRPHDGQPVNSATFIIAPHRPDHIVLITAGLLNREVKMWTSTSDEGWLLPSDIESWQCTQTLEIMSSTEPKAGDAFFNQLVALPRAGLLLLANAKKNAIYAVHIEYGSSPAATRMDYIAEFTVTMPILSLTGTSDSLPDGDLVIQIYCVQTQAIQQYALDLSQCLPTSIDNTEPQNTDATAAYSFDASDGSVALEPPHGKLSEISDGRVPPTLISSESPPLLCNNLASSEAIKLTRVDNSGMESKMMSVLPKSAAENVQQTSVPLPLSPRFSSRLSGFTSSPNSCEMSLVANDHRGEQPVLDYSYDQKSDIVKDNVVDTSSSIDGLRKGDKDVSRSDISMVPTSTVFKHPTHLVTPSEILFKAAASSENSQISHEMSVTDGKDRDIANSNDIDSNEVDVKVIGETKTGENNEVEGHKDLQATLSEKKEKSFFSQPSELSLKMKRDYRAEDILQANDLSISAALDQSPKSGGEEVKNMTDISSKDGESENSIIIPQSPVQASKGKRHKNKSSQLSGPSSSTHNPFNSTDSSNGPDGTSGVLPVETVMPQLSAMNNTMDELMSMQKELQKQLNVMVSVPVTKEGRRLEGSLGRSMEKIVKANMDVLWARVQEEKAKQEKLEQDHTQQMINLITNYINKDLPAMMEKTVKKEIAATGPVLARSITQILEKNISLAITESVQKGVGEKAINQLEKSVSSKLEVSVARQIQAQFQTAGKQALQDALKSSVETAILPAFDMSCKNMFEQVDATLQKGLIRQTSAAQQQFESIHSPLAAALKDAIDSASTMTRTLSGDLAEGQQKLLAIAAAGANSKVSNSLGIQMNNGTLAGLHEMAEAPLDPTKELSRLIAEHKFEEAFAGALHRSDVSIVSWLCSQVDLPGILAQVPLPLTQGVLLALLQQLACDVSKDTPRKLAWMTDVAVTINPTDPMIAMHVRPIFEQVYQILGHQQNLPMTSAPEASSIRLLMHVINSMLMSCK